MIHTLTKEQTSVPRRIHPAWKWLRAETTTPDIIENFLHQAAAYCRELETGDYIPHPVPFLKRQRYPTITPFAGGIRYDRGGVEGCVIVSPNRQTPITIQYRTASGNGTWTLDLLDGRLTFTGWHRSFKYGCPSMGIKPDNQDWTIQGK